MTAGADIPASRRSDPGEQVGHASADAAVRILEVVAQRGDIGASEIAAQLTEPVTSVHSALEALTERGYLNYAVGQRVYTLGATAHQLGRALLSHPTVPVEIAAAVRKVHDTADAAAYYAIYRGTEIVVAHIEDSEQRPRVKPLDVGFHEYPHATAFGKIMLAAMPTDQRRDYLDAEGTEPLTAATITDREVLEEHLSHVRGSQVALELGEFQDGLGCMASPVHNASGAVVGSVAISVPIAEFRARRWNIERSVRQGAAKVTRWLSRTANGTE